jgi:peroxiredoxin
MSFTETPDWSALPAPIDDGAARPLIGKAFPAITLPSTDGSSIDLSTLGGLTVIYAYPRTGRPNVPNPHGWDLIPGARGCTPQSCAFRDHFAELKSLRVQHLFGVATQDTAYQQEAAVRLHLPFPLLSDHELKLTRAVRLPTFQTAGLTLLKRFTLIAQDGVIKHVIYPVFPPDQNAAVVIAYLKSNKLTAGAFSTLSPPQNCR